VPKSRPSLPHRPREPKVGRRVQNKLDKLERIRRAAYTLFLDQGVDVTTLSEVAARAEVAKGTLFLYAEDKADLVCLVLHDRLARTVDEALGTLPHDAPLLAQLMHVFGKLFAMYGEHPDLTRGFVAVFPGARGPNAQRLHGLTFGFLASVGELVRRAQERGELAPEVPPPLAASNFFSLYFGSLLTFLSGLTTLELALRPLLENALALQIRGLLPRSPDMHYPPPP
jgi:TetR/AcrR family transcriptional regulator, cholesterol catabolism regulator